MADLTRRSILAASPVALLGVMASAEAFGEIPAAVDVTDASNSAVAAANPEGPALQDSPHIVNDLPKAETTVAAQEVAPAASSQTPVASNAPATNNAKANAMIAKARQLIGQPLWCNQLVSQALYAAGISFDGFPVQFKSLGTIIDRKDAQPGDLIIWDRNGFYWPAGSAYSGPQQHIALYIGNGRAIHGGFMENGGVTVKEYSADLSTPGASSPIYLRVKF
ncbi:MAG: NlpC/P60 family protein [Rothia sp. (in: high G+C Gram-positive bacteria)]|uniref:C40 family peptidase n=1 Tax=Rothia sp. (in: high G+C Gram-positive bacteria) TaxID=1885016 RepID=UPI0026E0E106|nr:NlpC/P60 family protein [Rothia sp. (in: high G+C Gram-positive bacteria)]MDO5750498.1 NlpC/P60 family protein [Rothia sp. (in: high G+C Gram-positive bacteria)]